LLFQDNDPDNLNDEGGIMAKKCNRNSKCDGNCVRCQIVVSNPAVKMLRKGSFVLVICKSTGSKIPIKKRRSGQLSMSV